ncbi:hypothetical protein [uncultured Roseibium sp.]|nr:hypothetical protein [uncultured Roseibium sp.]
MFFHTEWLPSALVKPALAACFVSGLTATALAQVVTVNQGSD